MRLAVPAAGLGFLEGPGGERDQHDAGERGRKIRAAVCCASTHSSHAADAYIGKANTCFSVSIHAPGFGSARAQSRCERQ
jgi:hypothetical protein